MKKKHTDKVRATFYIDKVLYQLLKRCSAIEDIPMSSIISNDLLEDRLRKYRFSTAKEWERVRSFVFDELEDEEKRLEYEEWDESPEGQFDAEKFKLEAGVKKGKLSQEEMKIRLKKAKATFEQQLKEERETSEELNQRWEKVCSEIPIE